MKDFDELAEGYREFLKNGYPAYQGTYKKLAERGQSPGIMVIGCCDSRVSPDLIFNVGPGDMFVVRNVANLVPPFEETGTYHGTSAALEFAVTGLKVRHIVVLGHSRCGGIHACLNGARNRGGKTHFIGSWTSIIADLARKIVERHEDGTAEEDLQQALEQAAIARSIQNLKTFPFIQDAIAGEFLKLHGAYFDIASARLQVLDKDTDTFMDIA